MVYKIFLRNFSKAGCSLLLVETDLDFTRFLSESSIVFPYFAEKQTRLLNHVIEEIKSKLLEVQRATDKYRRVEVWVPPYYFFKKLEKRFVKKLVVLLNQTAITHLNLKVSINSYKPSLRLWLLKNKIKTGQKPQQWYKIQNSLDSIEITEF